MTETIELDRSRLYGITTNEWYDEGGFDWICNERLRRYFDVPESATKLWLTVSSEPSGPAAYRAEVGDPHIYRDFWCIRFDGRRVRAFDSLHDLVERAVAYGPAWLWIEYEMDHA